MKNCKMLIFCILVVWIAMLGTVPASAAEARVIAPYQSYSFNWNAESIAAPVSHVAELSITGESLGIGDFNSPKDLFFDGNDTIYLLDSDNNRIVLLDKELKLKEVITSLTDEGGSNVEFTGATGIFADASGALAIADKLRERVIITDESRTVNGYITRPLDNEFISKEQLFSVTKVLKDEIGKYYVIVDGINMGALVFNADLSFHGFYGSNDIRVTPEVVFNYFWRKFMTKEQRAQMAASTSLSFTNFDIDRRGFIYTVSENAYTDSNFARYNFLGRNILFYNANSETGRQYGDTEYDRLEQNALSTRFVDADVDDRGFINIVDGGRGHIFQYSEYGDMVSVFGSIGNQYAQFGNPIRVESIGEKVLVLDEKKKCLFLFTPTPYTILYRNGMEALNRGEYVQAISIWEELERENTNDLYAKYSIGMAYYEDNNFPEAMRYFVKAESPGAYSKAFYEYRKILAREHFLTIFMVILALIAAVIFLPKRIARFAESRQKGVYSVFESRYLFPLHAIFHPIDGFEQFKTRKIMDYKVATGIIILFVLTNTISKFASNFCFGFIRMKDFDMTIILLQGIAVFLVFVVANWAITTLFSGKGTFKEIYTMTAYAMLPLILSMLAQLTVGQLLTRNEYIIYMLMKTAGIVWFATVLLLGLRQIHQYSLAKTIASVIASAVGMLIIMFLVILFYTLMGQIMSFITSIIEEISLWE